MLQIVLEGGEWSGLKLLVLLGFLQHFSSIIKIENIISFPINKIHGLYTVDLDDSLKEP